MRALAPRRLVARYLDRGVRKIKDLHLAEPRDLLDGRALREHELEPLDARRARDELAQRPVVQQAPAIDHQHARRSAVMSAM